MKAHALSNLAGTIPHDEKLIRFNWKEKPSCTCRVYLGKHTVLYSKPIGTKHYPILKNRDKPTKQSQTKVSKALTGSDKQIKLAAAQRSRFPALNRL
jgi:hypothetical protein